jgi:hypothetical protein
MRLLSCRRALVAAAALAATLAVAAPASADSIAYVKDGNVWLATPDGGRQQQVTTSGNYSYVSQADYGEMIALAPNERLHKLSRTGKVLADFPTMVSDGLPSPGPVNRFHGPFEPQISPDGTKVAFEWFNDSYSNDPSCTPSSVPPCYVYQSKSGVGITWSDRLTGPDEFGLLTGWIYPSWISNSKLLRSESGTILNDDAVFNEIGPGVGDDQMDHWMYDDIGNGVTDVELSGDLQTAVGIAGDSDQALRVYHPNVDPFNAPDWDHSPWPQNNVDVVDKCYQFQDPVGGSFETPSLSPDGRKLAYGVGDGIYVAQLPDLSGGCQMGQDAGHLVIPGGRHADWGPADIPPASAYVDGPGPGPGPGPKPGQKLRVSLRGAGLAMALRKGLTVSVRTSGPGRLGAKAVLGRKTIGKGAGKATAAGTAKVRVRFTKSGVRTLRRKRSVKLTVRVTFAPAGGGAAQSGSARLTLRR